MKFREIFTYRLEPINVALACQFIGAALLSLSALSATAKDVTLIKHYDKGYSPLLRAYLAEVLKTALDKTTADFGPYEMVLYSHHLSSNRSKLETERGLLLDILFSTHWRGAFIDSGKVVQVEYPIFDGMLGLRNLIVTKEQYERFSQLQSRKELLLHAAGQGSSWTDIEILKANNIKVVESQLFDGLFPMLVHHRYDYLPLSILEADTALKERGKQFSNLLVNEDLFLFYPMPFYLYVNADRPDLAVRLEKGLQMALEDGTVARLFEQHFHYIKPILSGNKKKLVILENPLISKDENVAAVRQFLDKYQYVFSLLPDH